jgi:hypothetical protein
MRIKGNAQQTKNKMGTTDYKMFSHRRQLPGNPHEGQIFKEWMVDTDKHSLAGIKLLICLTYISFCRAAAQLRWNRNKHAVLPNKQCSAPKSCTYEDMHPHPPTQ